MVSTAAKTERCGFAPPQSNFVRWTLAGIKGDSLDAAASVGALLLLLHLMLLRRSVRILVTAGLRKRRERSESVRRRRARRTLSSNGRSWTRRSGERRRRRRRNVWIADEEGKSQSSANFFSKIFISRHFNPLKTMIIPAFQV